MAVGSQAAAELVQTVVEGARMMAEVEEGAAVPIPGAAAAAEGKKTS